MNDDEMLEQHEQFLEAVSINDLAQLKQLYEQHRYPLSEVISEVAAGRGDLNILKWLIDIGCPWNEWTCSNAAKNGHLHIVQWARQNGCPWDSLTLVYASYNGHWHILHWLFKNKFLIDSIRIYTLKKNVKFIPRHFHSLKWLVNNYQFFQSFDTTQWFDAIDTLDDVIWVSDLAHLIKLYI